MSHDKFTWAVVAAVVGCLCHTADGGGRTYQDTMCAQGPAGACIPKRLTYGYTPTSWRRWPTDAIGETPKAAPEQVPTPAPLPKTPAEESQMPSMEQEEAPLLPTEREPPLPTPGAEPQLAPPFDDNPPSPPAESPGKSDSTTTPGAGDSEPPGSFEPPTESAVPGGLPEPPTNLLPPDTDLPPTMPDDDPFKDEPAAAEPPKSGSNPLRKGLLPERQVALKWRTSNKSNDAMADNSPLKPVPAGKEPRRLEPIESNHDDDVPEAGATVRRNPLREADRQSRDGRGLRGVPEVREEAVTPTAHWSVGQSSPGSSVGTLRPNPLRTN